MKFALMVKHFFLWGALKEKVYKEPPATPEDMRQRIVDACLTINADVIERTK
ncbi:hypothetical protein WH47_12203 [Habropoda laboriosa]|uniref:Uncharacterized protein n=1 Tax=Habropoda laboriosa TaxID=597456 RepID=A0A0L7RAK8_9HYME|nr:hypothetical protein WH47_12203 [Habropoda laboriosa]